MGADHSVPARWPIDPGQVWPYPVGQALIPCRTLRSSGVFTGFVIMVFALINMFADEIQPGPGNAAPILIGPKGG